MLELLATTASTPAAPFSDPDRTVRGEVRARVALRHLRTLWFNTGTLCNLACGHCYIESSPRNDRLAYLTLDDARSYLDEVARLGLGTEEIGFTGGEPFMNPDILGMIDASLAAGHRVLVLTNAMRPMMKCRAGLLELGVRAGKRLTVRVSLDHFRSELHEEERGLRTWAPTLAGLRWLGDNGFRIHVAGRRRWGDDEAALRSGFGALFRREGIRIDAESAEQLVLFPEMDASAPTPEVSIDCWQRLDARPDDMMCASSRMVVRRRGASAPEVVSCTLLPYDLRFSLGARLADALGDVPLNHPHCSRFCALGGGSCSV